MGSKGSKPRKPSHSQHLPKVGSAEANARLQQHEEREAIGDVMGVSGPVFRVIAVIGVIVMLGAVLGLVIFN